MHKSNVMPLKFLGRIDCLEVNDIYSNLAKGRLGKMIFLSKILLIYANQFLLRLWSCFETKVKQKI
jgi:hypothetical protein